jgi:hypothetical protein
MYILLRVMLLALVTTLQDHVLTFHRGIPIESLIDGEVGDH